MNLLKFVAFTLLIGLFCAINTSKVVAQDDVTYDEHIAPIFAANCVKCHNAQSAKGGYAMDNYDVLFKAGGSLSNPIEKGNADDSYIMEQIMPVNQRGTMVAAMPKKAPALSKSEISLISKWIDQGAKKGNTASNQTGGNTAGARSGNSGGGGGGWLGGLFGGGGNKGGQRGQSDPNDLIRTDPLLQIADMNGDGSLSLEELDTISRILHEMDWNKDGRLSKMEVNFDRARTNNAPNIANNTGRSRNGTQKENNAAPESSDPTIRQFNGFDRNKDGKLTRSELPGYLRAIMSSADTNKDRVLDQAEIAAYAESIKN